MTKRKKDVVPGSSDQKYSWRTVSKHPNFGEADIDREVKRKVGNMGPLKIKRRPDCFEVRLGTPIKKKD